MDNRIGIDIREENSDAKESEFSVQNQTKIGYHTNSRTINHEYSS